MRPIEAFFHAAWPLAVVAACAAEPQPVLSPVVADDTARPAPAKPPATPGPGVGPAGVLFGSGSLDTGFGSAVGRGPGPGVGGFDGGVPAPPASSLDPSDVRRVVMSHAGALRACWEIEAQRKPGLAGKVTLTWTIDRTGVVTAATVAATTLHDDRVEGCLLRQVESWRFPAGTGKTTATFPFVFALSDAGAP